MKAFVHIGTEKTGTSSIQLFLRKNRKALDSRGYHFLQSAGKTNNWALPAYCTEESRFDDLYRFQEPDTDIPLEDFRKDFIGKFEAEIRSLPKNIHTVVISSEHFHSRLRTDSEVNNFRELMSRFFDDIRIICYLREQADTCASWYSTSMKSGSTYSFHNFVRRCRPESYYFNYFEVLANWEQHFGVDAMRVAVFDRSSFLHGDLLDDFISRIDPQLVGKFNKSIHTVNESLKPIGQALCRALNIALPPSENDQSVNELRSRCKDLIARRSTGKGQEIDFSKRLDIYESFRESNEKLRCKYFPAMDVLFPPPAENTVQGNTVDRDFLGVVSEIFGILEDGGRKPLSADDYTRYWTAITRCIRDVIDVPEAVRMGGIEVVLDEGDALALRRAAASVEWEDLQQAERILTIARSVSPKLPGISVQLQEYRDRLLTEEGTAPKEKFLMIYHGEIDPMPADVFAEIDQRMKKWTMELEVPGGFHRIIPVSVPGYKAHRSGAESVGEPYLNSFTIFRASSYEEAQAIARRAPYLEAGIHIEVYKLEEL